MSNEISFDTNRAGNPPPFFSICIPQYNRTDFLIKACGTFAAQSFRDFEVCISDDCSTDGKESNLLEHLRDSHFTFTYRRNQNNLRYDGNLRSAIALSSGRYLILMGNDDGFSDPQALQHIHDELVRFQPIAVAITNYRESLSGEIFRRILTSGVLGHGPRLAASLFRRYSFVSGVVLEGEPSRKAATDALDGSEMYQMYLGTRLVAGGGRFLAIDRTCIDKNLQVRGQVVDSHLKPRLQPCPIIERPLPMGRLLEVVSAGLEPYHQGQNRESNLTDVARQLYRFIYPFWIIEYRRVQSWRYALGVLLAVRPTCIAHGLSLSWSSRLRLWLMYAAAGTFALSVPIALFDACRPWLYAFAKRVRSS